MGVPWGRKSPNPSRHGQAIPPETLPLSDFLLPQPSAEGVGKIRELYREKTGREMPEADAREALSRIMRWQYLNIAIASEHALRARGESGEIGGRAVGAGHEEVPENLERLRATRKEKLSRGEPVGRLPLVYRAVRGSSGTAKVEADESVLALIEEARQMRAEGYSIRLIRKAMAHRGLTNNSGKPLSISTVFILLKVSPSILAKSHNEVCEGERPPNCLP